MTHTILLAEDNPDHALLTTEAIESAHGTDIDIHIARDGQEALDFLFRKGEFTGAPTPNLVLLDIKMPVVDGFDVLERLKGDDRLRVVPVVMLTSSDDERDIAHSYGLGSNSYVTKPVDAESLFETVSRIPAYWFGVNAPPTVGEERST